MALLERKPAAILLTGIVAAGLIFGLSSLASAAPHVAAHAAVPAIDPRFAEASWSVFTQKSSTNALAAWLLRLPTWIGLIAFAAGALALVRKPLDWFVAPDYRLTESRA